MGDSDYDPRIVDLYDGDNPDGPDHDYYRALVDACGARSVLDVGCGTGILTVTLAAPGRAVVGLDPSATMLAYAGRRPGTDDVTWIHGDTRELPEATFDVIVMTGNVAQHISDPEWARTLRDLRRVSHSGTVIAFESRNPLLRAWEAWTDSSPTARETIHGSLSEWSEAKMLGEGEILLRSFNRFETSGDLVQHDQTLTFRTAECLSEQLFEAGFDAAHVWGDWERTPFDGTQPVLIIEARVRQ